MKAYYTADELAEVSEVGRDILTHIGTATSGRYPKGSGKNPYQHVEPGSVEWIRKHQQRLKALKAKGLSQNEIYSEIAKMEGMSVNALRSKINIMREEERQYHTALAKKMEKDGYSVKDIMDSTGWSQSRVRDALKEPSVKEFTDKKRTQDVVAILEQSLKDGSGYIDVGPGVGAQIGVTDDRLKSARRAMIESGEYAYHEIRISQPTNPKNKTTVGVLTYAKNDIKDVYANKEKIRSLDYLEDTQNAGHIQKLQPVESIKWDRVHIKYAIPEGEKGHGTEKDGQSMDGVILLRPGVNDLSLGKAHYAQVRIAVGGTHYLKGMAMYGDAKDFPPGVDVIFNTNKKKGTPKENVLKPLKLVNGKINDADPFPAQIKDQRPLLKDGKPVVNKQATAELEKRLGRKLTEPIYKNGAVNIVNEEGDWTKWSKTLSSQFLAKQPLPVVKERLKATLKERDVDYDEISKVTNPIVKRKLLESYIDGIDSSMVHIKASAPKGFRGHVLLPVPKMKENEIYAPNYEDGTRVILVRYPHAGRFEIPELIVNNKGPGRKIIGNNAVDAIGIHPKVAEKLSGADFDGDVAYVIPNNEGKYKSAPMLKQLKGFDPKQYQDPKGTFKVISKDYQQKQMGIVSNLITDMTLRGASDEELARATKHSMVVIDANNHKLNYKRSAKENNIEELRKRYMEHKDNIDYSKLSYFDKRTNKYLPVTDIGKLNKDPDAISLGASSVLSRRKQTVKVGGVNEEFVGKDGKKRIANLKGIDIPITNVISDASIYLNPNSTPTEKAYVDYINSLKARRNKAQKELDSIETPKKSSLAAKIYSDEVDSLNAKVENAMLNKPKERQATILANVNVQKELDRMKESGVELDKNELKKLRNKAMVAAREETGSKRNPVTITDIEWDAIQSGALASKKLETLLNFMDDTQLKELATPRDTKALSSQRVARAKTLLANGYTYAEIGHQLGVSAQTISRYLNE